MSLIRSFWKNAMDRKVAFCLYLGMIVCYFVIDGPVATIVGSVLGIACAGMLGWEVRSRTSLSSTTGSQ